MVRTVASVRVQSAPLPYTIVVCFEDATRRRFLMVNNRTRGWELPGGRIEAGESPQEGAVREFEEETGHRLAEVRPLLVQPKPNGIAHVFEGVLGPSLYAPRRREEVIVEIRFVTRLGDVRPLAFPDDPYGPIEERLGRRIR